MEGQQPQDPAAQQEQQRQQQQQQMAEYIRGQVTAATQELQQTLQAQREAIQNLRSLLTGQSDHARISLGNKIAKPLHLVSDGKNWEDFSFKFKAFVGSVSAASKDRLEKLELSSAVAEDWTILNQSEVMYAQQIYYGLSMLTSGAALRIVKKVMASNGFLAWKTLSDRFNPKNQGRMMAKLIEMECKP